KSKQAEDTHPQLAVEGTPLGIIHLRIHGDINNKKDCVGCQHHSANALDQPVIQPTTTKTGYCGYHIHTPANTINTIANSTTSLAPSRPPFKVSPTPPSIVKWRTPATV